MANIKTLISLTQSIFTHEHRLDCECKTCKHEQEIMDIELKGDELLMSNLQLNKTVNELNTCLKKSLVMLKEQEATIKSNEAEIAELKQALKTEIERSTNYAEMLDMLESSEAGY